MTLVNEGLKAGDLDGVVSKRFSVDQFKSKMGDDRNIMVLAFTVDGMAPAKDLERFAETGYKEVLDADATPGTLEDGKHRVFVEFARVEAVDQHIRKFLDDLKKNYYAEIKLRPGVTQEQQKAVDFFNRYNEDREQQKARHERFVSNTKQMLNQEFKGFDFKLGDKKFRYGIKDPSSVASNQSDLSNFVGKFLGKSGEIEDTAGYHKALYAAQNVDTIANHFYEQGKTDAIKDQLAKSKNINIEPRKTASGEVFIGGLKVKAISGLDSSKLKIKKRTFN